CNNLHLSIATNYMVIGKYEKAEERFRYMLKHFNEQNEIWRKDLQDLKDDNTKLSEEENYEKLCHIENHEDKIQRMTAMIGDTWSSIGRTYETRHKIEEAQAAYSHAIDIVNSLKQDSFVKSVLIHTKVHLAVLYDNVGN